MASYRLGVDVGGTFTDFVLLDLDTGSLAREKCLTTPHDPVEGIVTGLEKLIAAGRVTAGEIAGIAHATTLVANTLIERKGAETGLLATEGFRDIIELGNDLRYDMYDLAIEFPSPLAARVNRLGIAERIGAEGEVVQSPDPAQIREQVAALAARGVRSVAVCFMHSYRNPDHERLVGELIEREFPDLTVSLSSVVAPEIREFERTVTTLANAYVKPIMRSYLRRLGDALAQRNVTAPVLVMLSNAGMTTPRTAGEVPVRLVESGPAAGVLAAVHAGRASGHDKMLAFDMGGTTAKACFIDDNEPAFTGILEAARIKRQFRGSGLPLKVPSVEMIEIGAGGGSIARVDKTGLLKVGPDSAGANPGPVCYGRGGTNPTVTDADLLLGYLDPNYFLGGQMKLALDKTRDAVARVGQAAGLDPTETAAGILQVVNQNMATAIRIHAAERGKDYRRYALFAFGGAGPVHAYEIARILSLPSVICPIGAGTNSAFGLLVAPVAIDLSRSYNVCFDVLDYAHLNDIFRQMEQEAEQIVREAGETTFGLTRSVEMRFVGQGFELPVPVPNGKLDAAALRTVTSSYHAEYKKIYQTIPGDLPVESTTWRLRASGHPPKLGAAVVPGASTGKAQRTRQVYFPESKGFVQAAILDRYALKPGDSFTGPAVVEETESTLIIGPSGHATVDNDLNIRIEIAPKEPAA